ncbi:hypothetical protein TZ94_00955 [Streptococcus infantis]|uniref:Uncharacterized protein n=1 Tax=Streptococcus infantis TaxID=68892 RepID=A0A0F2E3T7_9STRE|nr:hypothetical protein [Streptococcus infantis]KJQ76456.1 hypothetical protein TZ94_00955 [Streptococcus infantis]
MPSIIEEIPMKIFEGIKEVCHLCGRKLQEYQRKVQIEENQKNWNRFLDSTQNVLVELVKENIQENQFAYTLVPIYEAQEVVQADGSKSVQRVHVADERVPIGTMDNQGIQEFGARCVVFRFQIFGEIDPDALLRIKDTWIFYLQKYALHGLADLYVKGGLRYLAFIICNDLDKRTIKGALFKLKHPWS